MTDQLSPIVALEDICKSFHLFASPADRLKERLFGIQKHIQHHALQDISFSLQAGEAVAILGQNGAGKSTLLKLITGVMLPDKGRINRNGKITGLLELGTGFDAELTGRDNISLNGRLIGMSSNEIEQNLEAIIDFAELGQYIDAPVKTYSSGMIMRLGFSIAIHANPMCFVVDEALAVGDARFQQKCLSRIKSFRNSGGALLFVSHDITAVKQLCERVIVLNKGRVAFDGDTLAAVNVYNQQLASLPAVDVQSVSHVEGYGYQQVRINHVVLQGEHGQTEQFATGEWATIGVDVYADKLMEDMTIGFLIRDRFGNDAFGTNTHLMKIDLSQKAQTTQYYRFKLPLNLGHGKYTLTVAVHSGAHHHDECQHWLDDVCTFSISGNHYLPFSGYCYLPTEFVAEGECE